MVTLGVEAAALSEEILLKVELDEQSRGFESTDMGHLKPIVYVVDDEKVIAETLAIILNQAGFIASSFQDPKLALSSAAFASAPDLLISDVVMPRMTGVELAIQFRRTYPRCKILLFSGQAATANLLEAARKDGYEFEVMSKPVHPADLLAKVREFSESEEVEQAPANSREALTQ